VSPVTLYTVGHSDRPVMSLIALLGEVAVSAVVDVRATPHSHHYPQYNQEALRAALEQAGMVYHWAGRQLGGRRAAADSPHTALEEGLRGFADYMESEAFARAATQLLTLAAGGPTALLCAERLVYCCALGDIFRAPQRRQGKARSAGNGGPLARSATRHWRLWDAPFGRTAGRPPAALRSLERE